VALRDAEVAEQQRHWLRGHRCSAIGMDGELAWDNRLALAGLLDKALGQSGGLAVRDHPADDVAAEYIDDHVEVVIGPFRRTK
jgi:hypothetical protein